MHYLGINLCWCASNGVTVWSSPSDASANLNLVNVLEKSETLECSIGCVGRGFELKLIMTNPNRPSKATLATTPPTTWLFFFSAPNLIPFCCNLERRNIFSLLRPSFSFSNPFIRSSSPVTYSFFFFRDRDADSRLRIIRICRFRACTSGESSWDADLPLLLDFKAGISFGRFISFTK